MYRVEFVCVLRLTILELEFDHWNWYHYQSIRQPHRSQGFGVEIRAFFLGCANVMLILFLPLSLVHCLLLLAPLRTRLHLPLPRRD